MLLHGEVLLQGLFLQCRLLLLSLRVLLQHARLQSPPLLQRLLLHLLFCSLLCGLQLLSFARLLDV